jgi:hypothetical protein
MNWKQMWEKAVREAKENHKILRWDLHALTNIPRK